MDEPDVISVAEAIVHSAGRRLTTPLPWECLACYVTRMVTVFGCDETLRWAALFRARRNPRATTVLRSLRERGATCDCRVPFYAFELAKPSWISIESPLQDAASIGCLGVPERIIRACGLWRETSS